MWGCLAALTTGTAGVAAEQEPASTFARAVEAYAQGETTDVDALLQSTHDDLRTQASAAMEAWLLRARAAEGTPAAAAERHAAIGRLHAAALLPLEILLSLSTRFAVHGQMEAFEQVATQAFDRLVAAERLPRGPGNRTSARDERMRLDRFRLWWRLAYMQYLANGGRHREFARLAAQVRPSADGARAVAEYHVMRGMVDEHQARMGLNVVVQAGRSATTPGLQAMLMALESASGSYRRALEAVPGHPLAQLRLGRTLLDRKKPGEALATLAPLMGIACRTSTCALAALFSGEAHLARGALDEASRAFALASSVVTVRQSALLALVHLATERGDPAPGRALIGHFAEGTPLGRLDQPDAWSIYMSGRRQDIEAVLAPAREARLR